MADSKRFLLRLNPELFEALRRWANDELRSINAQIEYLLADQARHAGRLPARRAKPACEGDTSGAKPSSQDKTSEEEPSPDADDEPGAGRARGAGSRTVVRL